MYEKLSGVRDMSLVYGRVWVRGSVYLRVLLRVGQVREYAEARAHVNARGVAAVSAGIDAPVGGSEMEGTGEPAEERSCAVAGARARARGGGVDGEPRTGRDVVAGRG